MAKKVRGKRNRRSPRTALIYVTNRKKYCNREQQREVKSYLKCSGNSKSIKKICFQVDFFKSLYRNEKNENIYLIFVWVYYFFRFDSKQWSPIVWTMPRPFRLSISLKYHDQNAHFVLNFRIESKIVGTPSQ